MPLHTTGLVSRHQLDHPNEKLPVPATSLNYERVLKYNPNHGPDGRFSSGGKGGGMKPGGTVGAPTHDAFGKAMPRYTGPRHDSTSRMDRGFSRGGGVPHDPSFHKGPKTQTLDPNFHKGEGDAEMAGSTPYRHALGGDPGTGGYKPPTPHGPYDMVKAPPGSSTRYKLVPHDPKQDAPNTREDSSWVLEMGRESTKDMDETKLNTQANRKIADKRIKAIATAAAAKVTSWDEAHMRANEAEFENYHEVATIYRARAKKLKH